MGCDYYSVLLDGIRSVLIARSDAWIAGSAGDHASHFLRLPLHTSLRAGKDAQVHDVVGPCDTNSCGGPENE
jgi:hypothetical protein